MVIIKIYEIRVLQKKLSKEIQIYVRLYYDL